ncbi:MAG: glycosyltransferase family 2 protein [Bacteroidia bacterium]|nr:glycosyltransferase family 2 protein [Bacteroidia bacterium]
MTGLLRSGYVIVPARNEAAALPDTLRDLLRYPWQVVVVDDGSTDETPVLLKAWPVHRLRHGVNLGQGAALQTGMDYARSRGAAWAAHFDADGQHQAADLARLAAAMEAQGADVVLGSRFLRAEDRQAVPPARRRLLRLARLLNGLLTGLWLTDAHNGLRVLNRRALEAIRLREPGMAHATEILSEIRRCRLRWAEAPVQIRYTEYTLHKGQRGVHAWRILGELLLRSLFSG